MCKKMILIFFIPEASVNDAARKRNGSLPGMGGVYNNTINAHLYHYAGNNPVKYTDPDGKKLELVVSKRNGTLTATYTHDKAYSKIGNLNYFTSAKTINLSVVTNVVSDTPDNTKGSDRSRFQNSSGGKTNPTQIANETYNIVPAQASEKVNPGPQYKYGEPDNNDRLSLYSRRRV
jgi:hypothetical protein